MFNFDDDKVVVKYKNTDYSWEQIKKIISPKICWLKNQKNQKLLLIAENNFEFILNFLSGIYAGKEIFLLTDINRLSDFDESFIKEVENKDCKVQDLDLVDEKKVFVNFYTSGSTGVPKVIKKSLYNLIVEAEDLNEQFSIPEGCQFLTTAKMTHMFGMTFALMYPLVNGYVINADIIKFPEEINCDDFVFISTPSFLDRMAKYDYNPYPPRYVFTAGDKLNDFTFKYFEKTSKVIEIYGSTESGMIAYRDSSVESFLNPFKKVEVLTDNSSQIIVKSDYFLEDELQLNDIIEKSGDKFKILGRSDRLFKVQEKRISAVELENILKKNEFIENSYCLKVGEKIGAAVVLSKLGVEKLLKSGSIDLIKELKVFMQKYSEIVPQRWRFLSELPKNSAGKTDRKRIEKIFALNLSIPFVIDKKVSKDEAELRIVFLKNSNFFKGHFPDVPVLPGVVQVFFAHFFAEDAFDMNISKNKIKKIKFSRVIKPDREVILKLKNNNLSLDFVYTDNESPFSSGTFIK